MYVCRVDNQFNTRQFQKLFDPPPEHILDVLLLICAQNTLKKINPLLHFQNLIGKFDF